METKKTNTGLTYGLIAGLALVVFTLILYVIGVESFLGPLAWLSYVIIIVVAILAGLRQRKLNGGYLEFSQALKVTFTVFALGLLIQTVFNYLLMNYIDTAFRDALTQQTMEKMEEMLRRFGASEDDIEKAIAQGSSSDSYALKNIFLGYGVMCIVYFIVALIISAIIKRRPNNFENTFNQ